MTRKPDIKMFFDEPTFTFSYVVSDPETKKAAIVDSVLNYDPASGRTYYAPCRSGAVRGWI